MSKFQKHYVSQQTIANGQHFDCDMHIYTHRRPRTVELVMELDQFELDRHEHTRTHHNYSAFVIINKEITSVTLRKMCKQQLIVSGWHQYVCYRQISLLKNVNKTSRHSGWALLQVKVIGATALLSVSLMQY